MKRFLNNMKFKRKILFIVGALFFVTTAVGGVTYYHYAANDVEKNFTAGAEDVLAQLADTLDLRLNAVEMRVRGLILNTSFMRAMANYLNNPDEKNKVKALGEMAVFLKDLESGERLVHSSYIYTEKGDFENFTRMRNWDFNFQESKFYQAYQKKDATAVQWFPAEQDEIFKDGDEVIPYVRRFTMDGYYNGGYQYLIVQLKKSELDRVLSGKYGYFDKILIDAPCSGEGMFRKEPSVMKSWVEHGNDYFVKLQQEITSYALKMLRPGGMLLYSTCTFSPLEDEQIVSRMLKEDQDLELVEPEWYEGFDHGHPEWSDNNQELTKCVRIWPHRMKGEGHFLALLKKKGESSRLKERQTVKAKMPQELFDFLQTVKKPLALDRLEIRQEKVFVHPDCRRDLKGLRIMRSGLLLGECLKNRFEPSQALAMALRADEYPNVLYLSREDDRVIRYLKGETIDLRDEESVEKGWVLICVDNYPLGFGKAAGGSVKNKYLAGWRWM